MTDAQKLLENMADEFQRQHGNCSWPTADDVEGTIAVEALLRIAIEAAAKVADVHFAAGSERHAIAAAIRALLPARKEGGD